MAGSPAAEGSFMVDAVPPSTKRVARGRRAQRSGLDAEAVVVAALIAGGWTVLGQRVRTVAGEVDIVAERAGLLVLVEVKGRANLTTAAYALGPRQRLRLMGAAAVLLGAHPDWGAAGVRFDVWLVDAMGGLRHVPDAFREGD
jgi:putative endonuclease